MTTLRNITPSPLGVSESETSTSVQRTRPATRRPLAWLASWLVSLALLAAGAVFLLSGLAAFANFAWPQPMFDQYRMYPDLFRPFPENVLQALNGHRPILPNLIRVGEMAWLGGDQGLQKAISVTCATLLVCLVSVTAWRNRELSRPLRAACMAAAAASVFWMANGRMFMHASEGLHVYLPATLLLCGAAAVHRASHTSAMLWMGVATICATAATFCFGSGIAAFPALILLAWISRVSMRAQAILVGGLLLALILYLGILPGDNEVRSVLSLQPLESMRLAARWLASPLVQAWMGFADPAFHGWMDNAPNKLAQVAWLRSSARLGQQLLHIDGLGAGATLMGGLGLLILVVAVLRLLPRRRVPSLLEMMALAMALFGGACALLIGLTRLDYLAQAPDQVFATRYLPWSCLFWLGIGVLLAQKANRMGPPARAFALLAACGAMLLLIPTHLQWTRWAEAAHQSSLMSGTAAQSGIFDPAVFSADESRSREDILRTLELFRRHRLAMYSSGEFERLGTTAIVSANDTDSLVVLSPLRLAVDGLDDQPFARFHGKVVSGIRRIHREGTLAVLDSDDRVVGFAHRGTIEDADRGFRFNIPRKRGFDGYIRHYSAAAHYRLALLDPNSGTARILVPIQ